MKYVGSLLGAALTITIGASSAWAGKLDQYEADITLINETGTVISVPGCNHIQGDCSLTDAPVVIQPEDSVRIGRATNTEHSAIGSYALFVQEYGKKSALNYKFDKNITQSQLTLTSQDDTLVEERVNLVIDPSSCTLNPNLAGALRCCSYKSEREVGYHTYKYDCYLPVRIQ